MSLWSRGVALLLFAIACAAPPGRAETLDAILARMDASARQFHSFSARITRTDFTAVINESEVMHGTIRMKRGKSGVAGVMVFTDPDPHTIGVGGRDVKIFHPKANAVEIYDTAKYTSVMDQYLLLGFGTTAAELRKAYDINVSGVETIGAANATRLDLTPKSAEVLKLMHKIDLWIAEGQSSPVQEKITKASKDTILVVYSDVEVNPPLSDSAFELQLPPGVKKLKPNK